MGMRLMKEQEMGEYSDTGIEMNLDVPEGIFPEEAKVDWDEEIGKGEILDLLGEAEEGSTLDVEESVEEKMEEIFEKLETNQVILVQGNTGCGKTTKIPRYLLQRYGKIVCSQPRKIAAISVAKKVAKDMNVCVGHEVGYSVRFDDMSGKRTRLKYVTDGILLREINSNKDLNGYDVVIIDEAHERSMNIDVLLGYLKMILRKRKDLRVIVMSATLSSEKFVSFFGCQRIEIRHRMFPLEIFFTKKGCDGDYLREGLKTVMQIHKSEGPGDILMFLTGKDEINNAQAVLSSMMPANEVEICCIYSTLAPEQQERVFKASKKRKVVLATNIAETSITIEGMKYIVDCGRCKQMRYSALLGMSILEVGWISRSQAKQRAGRAGRTGSGKVFRIYTKEDYKRMSMDTMPEILSSNLANTILLLKSIGILDITSFEMLDRPDVSNVKKALELLYFLRTIEENGKITALGRKAARIPVEPELAVSLLASCELGCLEDVSIIAAMLSVENAWIDVAKSSAEYPKYVEARTKYFDVRGDYFSLLRVYKGCEAARFAASYMRKKYLNIRAMHQAQRIKKQLVAMLNVRSMSDESKVVQSFCAGYFMNIAKIADGRYVSVFHGTQCYVHSSSSMFNRRAKYILYHCVFKTGREYVKHCVEVSEEDLVKGANHIFVKKRK
ncbi:putative helicase [Ordospora pajunii]|uniref:putative helicase n=1 Tax=Ordospora pajunii TaxID=3039483 RepID=UPI00295264C5|nr:putative helicase [Ordospora pajunii]KAH9410612.1 putative helicase [Ordospora pajunii]